MIANISLIGERSLSHFTPLFGYSDVIIPNLLSNKSRNVDVVFLDGGDNPQEQITEFQMLADAVPIGGVLFSHDAKLRKGKWLVPYLGELDNWDCVLHDVSEEGIIRGS